MTWGKTHSFWLYNANIQSIGTRDCQVFKPWNTGDLLHRLSSCDALLKRILRGAVFLPPPTVCYLHWALEQGASGLWFMIESGPRH